MPLSEPATVYPCFFNKTATFPIAVPHTPIKKSRIYLMFNDFFADGNQKQTRIKYFSMNYLDSGLIFVEIDWYEE